MSTLSNKIQQFSMSIKLHAPFFNQKKRLKWGQNKKKKIFYIHAIPTWIHIFIRFFFSLWFNSEYKGRCDTLLALPTDYVCQNHFIVQYDMRIGNDKWLCFYFYLSLFFLFYLFFMLNLFIFFFKKRNVWNVPITNCMETDPGCYLNENGWIFNDNNSMMMMMIR